MLGYARRSMESTTQAILRQPELTVYLNDLQRHVAAHDDPRASIVARTLRSLARRVAEPGNAARLRPSDLAQDAFVLLFTRVDHEVKPWTDRNHFRAAAATAMRHILIDHVRRQKRHKRGAEDLVSPDAMAARMGVRHDELPGLEDALDRLQQLCPDAATILQLRVFGGMSQSEIAAAMV